MDGTLSSILGRVIGCPCRLPGRRKHNRQKERKVRKMKTAQEPVATLRVTRLIKAPRERVFAAWTTPEDIDKWFGPETCKVLSARIDLRVGGEYRFRVNSPSCAEEAGKATEQVMEVFGIYREIKKPSRLVYTWSWEPKDE